MDGILFWHWLILGVLFFSVEAIVPIALFHWFASSAFITGFMVWLFPGLSISGEIFIFSMAAIISIVAFKVLRNYRPESVSPDPDLNNRLKVVIGKEYTLEAPIVDGSGRLKIGGSFWSILSKRDLPKGSKIVITGLEGIGFTVRAAQ